MQKIVDESTKVIFVNTMRENWITQMTGALFKIT